MAESLDVYRELVRQPSKEALAGLEQIADELADELAAIEQAYVRDQRAVGK